MQLPAHQAPQYEDEKPPDRVSGLAKQLRRAKAYEGTRKTSANGMWQWASLLLFGKDPA